MGVVCKRGDAEVKANLLAIMRAEEEEEEEELLQWSC